MFMIRIFEDGMAAIATAPLPKHVNAFKQVGFVECDAATYRAAERYMALFDGEEPYRPSFEDWRKESEA